jgi:hypothetical protein
MKGHQVHRCLDKKKSGEFYRKAGIKPGSRVFGRPGSYYTTERKVNISAKHAITQRRSDPLDFTDEKWVFRPTANMATTHDVEATQHVCASPEPTIPPQPIVVTVTKFQASMAISPSTDLGTLPVGRSPALMDGGANLHITGVDIRILPGYRTIAPVTVDLGDATAAPMQVEGVIPFWNGLANVHYCPTTRTTLVAENVLYKTGYGMSRDKEGTLSVRSPDGTPLFRIPISKNHLLEFDLPDHGSGKLTACMRGGKFPNRAMEAHLRMAHANWDIIKAMNESGAFGPKIPVSHFKNVEACVDCAVSKAKRAVKPGASTRVPQ